ncbi:unnamed protein product [Somion occarium]|uniref:TMEM205-like domain-containing protein n=1 Tax=Somion occarium TaxID=3059160 RepID=A0ABP1CNP7_9APHY
MSKVETLTFGSIVGLFTLRGGYLIAYSWLFGMSLWVTFIGGVIAFKALPRQQFGALQHRTFPIYFALSISLSSLLLGLWTKGHPSVLEHLKNPQVADVTQAYALAAVILSQAANQFIVGPLTSKTMFQRHKLEKAEGKSYNESGICRDEGCQCEVCQTSRDQLSRQSDLLHCTCIPRFMDWQQRSW